MRGESGRTAEVKARAAGVWPRDLRNVEGGKQSEQDAQQRRKQLEGKRREETLGSPFVIELSDDETLRSFSHCVTDLLVLQAAIDALRDSFVTLLKHVRSFEMTHIFGNGAALLLFLSCMYFFMLQPLLALISNTAELPAESLSSTTARTSSHWPPSCSLSLLNIASCIK